MHSYSNLLFTSLIIYSAGVSASLKYKATFEDPFDRTPIQVGKRNGCADKKEMSQLIQRVLFAAASEGNIEKLTKLAEQYGDLDIMGSRSHYNKGLTPIYFAVKAGKLDAVSYLAHAGAHMTRLFPREVDESSHLELAAEYGRAATIEGSQGQKLSQEPGPSHVDQTNSSRSMSITSKKAMAADDDTKGIESLLDIAIRYGHCDIALFLSQFIPLWMPNGEGQLPVCNALRLGRIEIAKKLISAHRLNSKHLLIIEGKKGGQSALSCARSLGYYEVAGPIVEILAEHKPDNVPSETEKKTAFSSLRSSLRSPWAVLPGLLLMGLRSCKWSSLSRHLQKDTSLIWFNSFAFAHPPAL